MFKLCGDIKIKLLGLLVILVAISFPVSVSARGISERTVPTEPLEVTAKAGDESAVVSFKPPKLSGSSTVTTYVVTSYPDGITVAGGDSPITIEGLRNGVTYCFSVAAVNSTGFSNESLSNAVTPTLGKRLTEEEKLSIQDEADKKRLMTSETVFLEEAHMIDLLLKTRRGAVISVTPSRVCDISTGSLNGDMVRSMSEDKAYFELKTQESSFKVAAEFIPFENYIKQMGEGVKKEDVDFKLQIVKTPYVEIDAIKKAAVKQNLVLISEPLTFKMAAVKHLKRIEIESLAGYSEKWLPIPNGIDPSKVTTAMVLSKTGKLCPVPTTIVKVQNKAYAKVKSLVNGTFTLVSNPTSYTDLDGDAIKPTAKNLGSRLIMNAVEAQQFMPEKRMTRAEFVACIVSALGLKVDDSFSRYADVKNTDWFRAPIQAAYDYKLIEGTNGGFFRPNDWIKREEAVVILANALKWAETSGTIEPNENLANLNRFIDQNKITSQTNYSVVKVLGTGIISGRNEHIFGKDDFLTRRQVALSVEALLKKTRLIE